jgi:arylsulfatase A-like enzyme
MNIILLISDTFRYDNFFDRADVPVRTPHLDRFTERAVSCSRMYMGSFPTIPHRTEVTSGRYGWPWHGWQNRPLSGKNHLPLVLGKHDYASQLICDCPHLYNAEFHKGFTAAQGLRGQEGDMNMLRMNFPIESAMPREKTRFGRHFQDATLVDLHCWTNHAWTRAESEDERFPPRTAGKVVNFLEQNYKHDPFFLWVDFFDPHEPWDPPEYMVRRYQKLAYDGPAMLHPNYGKAGDYSEAELENLRAHYCADAELVDRWVGRVLEKIDDLGLWDNSIVVFTADHGTCLGEHDRTGKSNINKGDDRFWPIYPEIAHIPFLVAAPGLKGGGEIDLLLQPPDIMPTLLDLAGLDATPPNPFHGKSFAPALRGEDQASHNPCAITATHMKLPDGEIKPRAQTPVVYTEKWAFAPIGSDGEAELYDMETDPRALTNVAPDNPTVVEQLREEGLAWLRRYDAPEEWALLFRKR